jgi:hypothetical protein
MEAYTDVGESEREVEALRKHSVDYAALGK